MESKKRENPDHCDCGASYKEHSRCRYCTKLTHGEQCRCRISPLIKEYDHDRLHDFLMKIALNELK